MIDLSLHRARASLGPDATAERKRAGAALVAQLKALALAVEHVLPELAALSRTLTRPDVAVLSVAWHAKGTNVTEAPQLVVALLGDRIEVSWGFQPARGERRERDRQVAEMARRRRALGDGLVYRLVALRAAGAELYASRREQTPVSEEEWLRAAAGVVAFRVALHEVPEGAVLARLVADRLARLAALASLLGSFVLEASPMPARTRAEVVQAIRSLRWDERALGTGAPPAGLVTTGRSV